MRPSIFLTEFDEQTIGRRTQLLKALIPFMEPERQKTFAIMVRIMEFNMTLEYYNKCPHPLFFDELSGCTDNEKKIESILSRIACYCSSDDQKLLNMLKNLIKANQFGNMMDLFNSCSFTAPPCSDFTNLSMMLTPKQQEQLKEFEKLL